MGRTITLANALGQVEELLGLAIPEPFHLHLQTWYNQGRNYGAPLYKITIELTTGRLPFMAVGAGQNIDLVLQEVIEKYNVHKAATRRSDSVDGPVNRGARNADEGTKEAAGRTRK